MKKEIHLQQTRLARKRAHLMSVLLANGNLVVPKIMQRDPFVACWVEVEPGSAEFKRWFPVHEAGRPDPRTLPGYLDQLEFHDPEKKFRHTLKGVHR
jgi:hypothetical protein